MATPIAVLDNVVNCRRVTILAISYSAGSVDDGSALAARFAGTSDAASAMR
jgi:hypothetical protein